MIAFLTLWAALWFAPGHPAPPSPRPTPTQAATSATVAVLPVEPTGDADPGLAQSLTAVIRGEAAALGGLDVAAGPALPRRDLQLALGCAGETPTCLGAVASRLSVEILVMPQVHRDGETLILSMGLYRAGREGPPKIHSVQAAGPQAAAELVSQVTPALRVLFDRPAPEVPLADPKVPDPKIADPDGGDPQQDDPKQADPQQAGLTDPGAVAEAPSRPVPTWVGYSVAGLGGALVLGGVITGAMASSAESDYADASVGSEADIDKALDHLDTARSRARAANWMYGLGAAAIVAGAVCLHYSEGAPWAGLFADPGRRAWGLSTGVRW